jgi:hypothetical protein
MLLFGFEDRSLTAFKISCAAFPKVAFGLWGNVLRDKGVVQAPSWQDGPMKNHERYQNNAEQCLRLANGTSDPGIKGKLIDMAELWMKLAKKTERNNEVYRNKPSKP